MKGFILGILASAIAFVILINVLPASMISFEGEPLQLALLALAVGVVNAVIKPIVKILSFPISLMTLGLAGIVINAGLLARRRLPRRQLGEDQLHDRRLAGRRVHGRHGRRRGGRVRPARGHLGRRRAGRQGLIPWPAAADALRGDRPGGCAPGGRQAVRDAVVRHVGGVAGRRRGRAPGGLPGPVAARVLAQGERRAGRGRAARGGGPGRERGLVGRMGGREAGRRPERPDHAGGRGQDGRRPAGCGAGRGCRGVAALGRRGEPRGAGGTGIDGAACGARTCGGAAAGRAAPPEPGRASGDPRGACGRPRRVQVRDDRDGAHGSGRGAVRRTGRCGCAACISTSARSWGRWTRGGTRCDGASPSWRWWGPDARTSTRSTSAAGSRSASPGRYRRPSGSRGRSGRCWRRSPPDRRPRRLAVEPGRFLVARAGWLVASVLHVRERDRCRRAARSASWSSTRA